ncbi:MerR family transcriptional regulator [Streptomyces sp. NPDC005794]|uniref:MerR family transcriptional regulator n=1 Tax=Streptomyces sp. NPDC005794 TaxID=3364733 RepID=UPI0036BF6689
MRIGELAARAGVSTRALRYYEEQGLLSPHRTSSGQRVYPEAAVDRVKIIQQLYTAGLGSRLLATLLPAIDARSVGPELLDHLLAERARIGAKAAELQAAGRRLDVLIELATHPDTESCPASLDRPDARQSHPDGHGDARTFDSTSGSR